MILQTKTQSPTKFEKELEEDTHEMDLDDLNEELGHHFNSSYSSSQVNEQAQDLIKQAQESKETYPWYTSLTKVVADEVTKGKPITTFNSYHTETMLKRHEDCQRSSQKHGNDAALH
jgi:DNA-binding transcriptional regulator GbsR (MarR family)